MTTLKFCILDFGCRCKETKSWAGGVWRFVQGTRFPTLVLLTQASHPALGLTQGRSWGPLGWINKWAGPREHSGRGETPGGGKSSRGMSHPPSCSFSPIKPKGLRDMKSSNLNKLNNLTETPLSLTLSPKPSWPQAFRQDDRTQSALRNVPQAGQEVTVATAILLEIHGGCTDVNDRSSEALPT